MCVNKASQPLVSCIMPTYNRRKFVPQAIHYFLRQDYLKKELIIIDDGTDPIDDLLQQDDRIHYYHLLQKHSVGAKRNIACSKARGDIIAHWDDDDWYAVERLSVQVAVMRDPNINLCGINRLLYYDMRSKRAYEYRWNSRDRPWLSMLCYRYDLWKNRPFPDVQIGSDTRFIWQIDQQQIKILENPGINVCTIHETNVSPKHPSGEHWYSTPVDNVRKIIGEDWSFYNTSSITPINSTRNVRSVNRTEGQSGMSLNSSCDRFDWSVIIPTYERPKLLAFLLADLERETQYGARLDVRVYDDASRQVYNTAKVMLQRNGWLLCRAFHNHGKRLHWRWIDRAFRDLKIKPPGNFILFLHDDYRLCDRFFERVKSIWESIDDPKKISLTLAVDKKRQHTQCWTGVNPIQLNGVCKTQWVDGAFMAERRFFDTLSYRVPPVRADRWSKNPNCSSGVGQNLSISLVGAGFNLYRVTKSLARHVDAPSVLHPDSKTTDSAKTVDFIDEEEIKKNILRKPSNCSHGRRSWIVVIMSFERPIQLIDLLYDLEAEKSQGIDLEVRVYDDASSTDYSAPKTILERNGWHYYRAKSNHGKKDYWRWVSRVYQDLRNIEKGTLLAFLQDDVRLCNSFFNRAEGEWNAISDPRKVTLTILVDEQRVNRPCWTEVYPKQVGRYWQTQWVDQIFISDRNFLMAIDFQVPQISSDRWRFNSDLSSGVGQALSLKLHQSDWHMFQVCESLVVHVVCPSVMNKNMRRKGFLKTMHFVDGLKELQSKSNPCQILASLATIPGREYALHQVINNLLPQVDRLRVYLNGFKEVPDFLEQSRIEIAKSSDYGDLGDSGKFFWCAKDNGYLLICDDDMVYPSDYVSKLIAAIEKYKRRSVVGFHGVILSPPVHSYYHDRNIIHFTSRLDSDKSVHILATNSVAFHSSTLELSIKDFKLPNMADIWLGRLCQRQRVPLIAISRKAGWLQAQDVPNTIYDRYKNNDKVQTRIINETGMWCTFPFPIN